MTEHSKIFKRWDVVAVPFPFTDLTAAKRRPAIVLNSPTFQEASGHVILGMITSTSAGWRDDVPLSNPASAGLSVASRFRPKLVTLSEGLVLRRLGRIHRSDQEPISLALSRILS